MEARLVAYAIPMFVLLIAAELIIAKILGARLYRFADAMTDLACGIASRIFHLFDTALLIAVYAAVYTAAAPWQLPEDSPATWIAAFIGVDILYYWWHRASHGSSVLWAVHAVHHQSEDYNLAVALRQALFSGITSMPFYLPLALLGVPPVVFATCQVLNTLYQFWIHTDAIDRIGPFERWFNSASHHRVHHGSNLRYIDRNHGGILIIWDRLFGTLLARHPLGAEQPLNHYVLAPHLAGEPFRPFTMQQCKAHLAMSCFRATTTDTSIWTSVSAHPNTALLMRVCQACATTPRSRRKCGKSCQSGGTCLPLNPRTTQSYGCVGV